MINQLRADWYRQWHARGFYGVLLFSIFYGLLVPWQHMLGGVVVNAPEKLLAHLARKHWTLLDTLHAATMSATILLYVFIALFVLVVGYEFSQHTYKNTLISGVTRLQFVLSKYLLLLVDVCFCMCLYFGAAVVFGRVSGQAAGAAIGTLWRQGLLLGATMTFFISVVFALAVLILLTTGSMVFSAVFVVVWPLLISMINSFIDWHWLAYLDFFNAAMKITLGLIRTSAQVRYLGVSVAVLLVAVLGATAIIRRREL